MKRIVLFTMALLFVFSTIGFAEQGKSFVYSDNLIVSFPEDWTTQSSKDSIVSLSPSRLSTVFIYLFPISYSKKSLDDRFTFWQKYVTATTNPTQIEKIQSLYIDNREARMVIYSGYSSFTPKGVKSYWIDYFVYGDQFTYDVFIMGLYNELETNRKIIDVIISSIKILK